MRVKVRLLAPLVFSDGMEWAELDMPPKGRVEELIGLVAGKSNIGKYGQDQVMILIGDKIACPDDPLGENMEVRLMLRPMGG
ncbi:MAG: hypothetical protein L5656_08270 [Thermanaeromonas sp.]|uniref:hypothetical protein n=1 Tax=Thermanaeromonas sp. TaxID=2003697 RepID=UPI002440E53F|nr:hypothetical protein [Thermanaeromonas sp.]MCG0278508.1 hypothetical protein [Thermanaeromonas sp.]